MSENPVLLADVDCPNAADVDAALVVVDDDARLDVVVRAPDVVVVVVGCSESRSLAGS